MELEELDVQMTAADFMEQLVKALQEGDGVTHLTARVQDPAGNQQVLVIHAAVEAIMDADEFEEALNEALAEQEADTTDNPVTH